MGTINVNASASLSATGTSTATGSITWAAPSYPDHVTSWDSIVVSGTWSWTGQGNIQRVTINGTNTSNGVPFSVSLGTSTTSPLSISCVGNKKATGSNFTWSNLQVTYTYTPYYNVSVVQSEGGTISLSQTGSVAEGTTITVSYTELDGYKLENIYVNGVALQGNSFVVAEDSIVTAVFVQQSYTGLYFKENGAYVPTINVYKKISGVWIVQNDIETLFDANTKYIKKN